MNKLLEAISIASFTHKAQKRKGDGNAPYINHLIEVAHLLSDLAEVSDEEVLIAAVLHDALEDTELTCEIISSKFGNKVLNYIEAVTDDKTLSLEERRKHQVEHMANASVEIQLIKLADHCSNAASIPPNWDKARATDYIEWSYLVASQCFHANEKLASLYKRRYKESKDRIKIT